MESARALREAGAFDPDLTHLDADLQEIEDVYRDSGGEFLVGTVDGAVVTMGAYRPLSAPKHDAALPLDHRAVVGNPETTALLKRLRVDPAHYRRGFATGLVDELEARARVAGFETAVLDTTPTQTAAITFYEDRGYELVEREETDHGPLLFYRTRLDG